MATVPYAHLFKRCPCVPQTPFPPRMVQPPSKNPGSWLAGNIIEECNSDFQKKRKLWNCPLHSKHIFFPSTWQIGILQLFWHSAKHIIVLLSAPRNQNSIYFLLLKVNLLPGDFKLNLKYWSANGLAFPGEQWKLKGMKLALPEATSSMSFKRRACFFHLRLCFDSNVAATWGVEAQVFEQQREVWPLFRLAASPEAEAGFW